MQSGVKHWKSNCYISEDAVTCINYPAIKLPIIIRHLSHRVVFFPTALSCKLMTLQSINTLILLS